jgi:hypothetical protein
MTVAARGVPVVFGNGGEYCAEALLYVPNYERPFFSEHQADEWRAMLRRELGLHHRACPPNRAVLLRRSSDNSRRRGFVNEAVVDAVAAELGIRKLHRVTVGSRNSTEETAALFASFGLLVSTHSSQLKGPLYAAPHAAVVEVTGSFLGTRPSPFSEGMAELRGGGAPPTAPKTTRTRRWLWTRRGSSARWRRCWTRSAPSARAWRTSNVEKVLVFSFSFLNGSATGANPNPFLAVAPCVLNQCLHPPATRAPPPSPLASPVPQRARPSPPQYIMCRFTVEGSTLGLSSRHAGPVGALSSDVLPCGPSHDSCPFMGLLPHLAMWMGLPARHDSSTSTAVAGVRHS